MVLGRLLSALKYQNQNLNLRQMLLIHLSRFTVLRFSSLKMSVCHYRVTCIQTTYFLVFKWLDKQEDFLLKMHCSTKVRALFHQRMTAQWLFLNFLVKANQDNRKIYEIITVNQMMHCFKKTIFNPVNVKYTKRPFINDFVFHLSLMNLNYVTSNQFHIWNSRKPKKNHF